MATGNWIEFEPDHQGIGRMLNGPEFGIMAHVFAEHGMRYAQSISPVGPARQDRDEPRYVDSFEVRSGLHEKVTARGGPRSISEVWNTASYAATVEWHHDHHVLGRMVDEIEAVRDL